MATARMTKSFVMAACRMSTGFVGIGFVTGKVILKVMQIKYHDN